jgi:hypothetical protein
MKNGVADRHLAPARRGTTRWPAALLLGLLPCLSGCLVIDKKTLILFFPPDSDEVRMYYTFEGLSVCREESGRVDLEAAKRQMMALRNPDFSFFITQEGQSDNPLLEHFRFNDLHFFVDPGRKRKLCADRQVTIFRRKAFARGLNEGVSRFIRENWTGGTDAVRAKLRELREEGEKPESIKSANDFGVGPLLRTGAGLAGMAAAFDNASLERVREAANADEYEWFRFGPDAVRLTFPVTRECAGRIARDPKTAAWLKDMRTFVEPIDVRAVREGLVILVGEKGRPVRLSYRDPRPCEARLDDDLISHVGNLEPVLKDVKPGGAARRVEAFLAGQAKGR